MCLSPKKNPSSLNRAAIESTWQSIRGGTDLSERGERVRRVIIVLIWFFASLALALIAPDIGVVIKMLGGLAALFAFTFPGYLFLYIFVYCINNCV